MVKIKLRLLESILCKRLKIVLLWCSVTFLQVKQWGGTTVLCLCTKFLILKNTTECNQNINKQIIISSRRITSFLLGITILNQKIIYKDDIKIVNEFPCLSGHPVDHFQILNIKLGVIQYIQILTLWFY